jgi:thiosulfate dehydrogenase (quinone) large subunit
MTRTEALTTRAQNAGPGSSSDSGSAVTPAIASSPRGGHAVDILRIGLGFIFLWPFLDKAFGLGYSTPGPRAWINSGSPTNGFLGHVQTGPFQSAFRSIAGAGWADTLFMLALLGIGVALILGVMLRFTAFAGTALLVLMWAAEWPMARHDSLGAATGSTNPVLDDHLIFAIALFVIAAVGTASSWGLGKWWASRQVVADHPFLR